MIFERLVIYRVERGYRYITHKLRHKKGYYSTLALTVKGTTRGYFDLWQNNPAYYKKHLGSNIDYKISRARLILCNAEDDDEDGEGVELGKEVILDEGKYKLKVHLCQEKEYDFTISYYGEKDVAMERVRVGETWP
jgi:hypothetical protein